MNNTFNISRFALVLGKDFQEGWKRYSLQFLVMLGIMIVVLTWISLYAYSNIYTYEHNGVTYSSIDTLDLRLLLAGTVMFLGFGIVFTSTLMEPMRSKIQRISYLSMPATDFEKFFSRWLIVSVGYVVAFFIALWFADALRIMITSMRHPGVDVSFLDLSKMIAPEGYTGQSKYLSYSRQVFVVLLSLYIFIQSLFVLGATFWEKASFIKTFSAVAIIVTLFILLCRWAIIHSYANDGDGFGVMIESLGDENAQMLVLTCIFLFLAVVNWVVAGLRFRESEIIQRW
ncbi:MAG: hypothetical protein BGO29_06895 [Bacteroidales bacterium 36-12]|nr:MAG: hypothetical protein BGO29_06895 [Bacteroidales bacterium 36-12]